MGDKIILCFRRFTGPSPSSYYTGLRLCCIFPQARSQVPGGRGREDLHVRVDVLLFHRGARIGPLSRLGAHAGHTLRHASE